MRILTASFGITFLILLAGCGSTDERQWMKINESYTVADFQRDVATCSNKDKINDDCMRSRGWVAVTPRAEKPQEFDPRRQDYTRKGY
jgi:hypothetical protein